MRGLSWYKKAWIEARMRSEKTDEVIWTMASPIDRVERFLRDRFLLRLVVVASSLEMREMRETDMEDDDREDVYPMIPPTKQMKY